MTPEEIEFRRKANGYAELGRYIGYAPENAMFSGFQDLYAENLLYLQAEVVHLSKDLRSLQDEDRKNDRTVLHHLDWAELRSSATKSERDGAQFRKILELRKALDDYYDSLFRYEKLLSLSRPRDATLGNMSTWMDRESLGNIHIYSWDGELFETYTRKAEKMVSLDPSHFFDDLLSFWVSSIIVGFYHRYIGRFVHRPDGGEVAQGRAVAYNTSVIAMVTRFLTVTIACALPTITILILLFTPHQTAKLCVIFIMSLLFAWCVSSMSAAKTQEIFAVTAAFAAVCVVFVSTEAGGADIKT